MRATKLRPWSGQKTPSQLQSYPARWTRPVASFSFADWSERACSGSARPSDVAERPLGCLRVARQLRQLAELGGDLDFPRAGAGRKRHRPPIDVLRDPGERDVVERGQAFLGPDAPLRRLNGERPARSSPVVRERDPAGQILVDQSGNVVAFNPAVVDAVRETDGVAREPVAADVGALPGGLRTELLAERLEQRPAGAGTAWIVLPVRAGEKKRLVDLGRRLPRVDVAQILVVGDLEPGEALPAFARVGDVDGEVGVMTAIRPPDEEEAGAGLCGPELPYARLYLV